MIDAVHAASAIEAILFTMGSSVEGRVLAQACHITPEELPEVIRILELKYEANNSGIQLIRLNDSFQLCTKPEYYPELVAVATQPIRPNLTEVMLEVLSIIAYREPVTKAEIEHIRGVSSDYAVNRLLEIGLIEEAGRQDSPGRPILLKTSEDFLRKFGLSSVRELPPLSEEIMRKAAENAVAMNPFTIEGQLSFDSLESGNYEVTGYESDDSI